MGKFTLSAAAYEMSKMKFAASAASKATFERERLESLSPAARALRVFGLALARGECAEHAMAAAIEAIGAPEGLVQQQITFHGIPLNVAHDGDPEEGWSITVDPGTDIAGLFDRTELYEAVAELVDADLKVIHQRELDDAREAAHFIGGVPL